MNQAFLLLLNRRKLAIIAVMPTLNLKQIRQLHEHAAQANSRPDVFLDLIWNHSHIVAEIALQLADRMTERYGIQVNRTLMEAGALVHDIGVYGCFDGDFHELQPGIRHGLLGFELLRREGVSLQLARFALAHTGVGITRANIEEKGLPLPLPEDPAEEPYVPLTLEERLVCWADNFHTKQPGFNSIEGIRAALTQHYAGNAARVDQMELELGLPRLEDIQARYANWHAHAIGFASLKAGE